MVQVIETEPLRCCPFCDGEPELRVSEHPIDESRKVAKVVCLQCNAGTSSFSTGKDFFTGKETTLDEAIKKAARAWNCRPEMETREQEREAYIKALPKIKISAMFEAVKLSDYAEAQERAFCNDMALLYGCRPLKSDGGNFIKFLSTLYHYGKVQGIRRERARRQKLGHEVAEIARELTENPLLYQVMKTAAELNSVEPLIQAANFLKGAKKNED